VSIQLEKTTEKDQIKELPNLCRSSYWSTVFIAQLAVR